MVMIFYLFLGFCGFFLLVLLLSIILISQSVEEEEVLIDDEHEDEEELGDDVEKGVKVVRQSERRVNVLVYKIRQFLFSFNEFLCKIIRLPVFLYSYYVQCTLETNNDFITIE